MPPPLFLNNGQYTPISTIGTQTLNPGTQEITGTPQAPLGQQVGVLYGFLSLSTGTAGMTVTYLDIYTVVSGIGTSTVTNTLLSGTPTPGSTLPSNIAVGIRYRGALVLVTSGTAGAGNSLWD